MLLKIFHALIFAVYGLVMAFLIFWFIRYEREINIVIEFALLIFIFIEALSILLGVALAGRVKSKYGPDADQLKMRRVYMWALVAVFFLMVFLNHYLLKGRSFRFPQDVLAVFSHTYRPQEKIDPALKGKLFKIQAPFFSRNEDNLIIDILFEGETKGLYGFYISLASEGYIEKELAEIEEEIELGGEDKTHRVYVPFKGLLEKYHKAFVKHTPDVDKPFTVDERLDVVLELQPLELEGVSDDVLKELESFVHSKAAALLFTFRCDHTNCQITQQKL